MEGWMDKQSIMNDQESITIQELKSEIIKLQSKVKSLEDELSKKCRQEDYDVRRYRLIAEKYYEQAAPVRKSMHKFLDQVEEQINDLRQKNLLGNDLVGKFIKHLEWLIQMFRREI